MQVRYLILAVVVMTVTAGLVGWRLTGTATTQQAPFAETTIDSRVISSDTPLQTASTAVASLPFLWQTSNASEFVGSISSEGDFAVEEDCVVFRSAGDSVKFTVAVWDQLESPLRNGGTVLRVPMHRVPLGDGTIYQVSGERIGSFEQLPTADWPGPDQRCPREGFLVTSVRLPAGAAPTGTAVAILLDRPDEPTGPVIVSYYGRRWSGVSDATTELRKLELLADEVDGLAGWELWSTFRDETLLLSAVDNSEQVILTPLP